MKTKAITPGSGNVFADLGFSPARAADLNVKAQLTRQIYNRIKQLGLTQEKAAGRLGISQPDVSKLMNARYTGYSIDRLLMLLSALQVDVDIVVKPLGGRKTRSGTVRVKEAAAA